MSKKDEMWVSPKSCIHGSRAYRRVRADGTVEHGALVRPNQDMPPGAMGVVELEHVEGDRFSIKQEIKFTGGHSRPANSAYRSGWDNIFGKRARCPSPKN